MFAFIDLHVENRESFSWSLRCLQMIVMISTGRCIIDLWAGVKLL
jgi:hypothetical protein